MGPDDASTIDDGQIRQYETALDAVIDGQWQQAGDQLERLSAADGPTRFLKDLLAAQKHQPPEGWDGAFSLSTK